MSRIVIIAVGSRGDVAPLTGLGVALKQAGHTVSIAAYTPFANMITNCGLGFGESPAKLGLAADGAEVAPMKGLAAFASPTGMRALGYDILGAWSAGAAGNRGAARMGAWLIDRIYGRVVADFRRELGLPRIPARALRRQRTDEVCADFYAAPREFIGEHDPVHLLVHYPPKAALSKLVNSLNGVTARRSRQEYEPHVRKHLWGGHFWSGSYFSPAHAEAHH